MRILGECGQQNKGKEAQFIGFECPNVKQKEKFAIRKMSQLNFTNYKFVMIKRFKIENVSYNGTL